MRHRLIGFALGIVLGVSGVFHFGTMPATAQIPSRVISLTDVTLGATAVQIVPANASRRSLSCTNNDGSAHARWGDNAITTARGQRIAAGSTITITATAAIFMIAESGAPVVSCVQDSL